VYERKQLKLLWEKKLRIVCTVHSKLFWAIHKERPQYFSKPASFQEKGFIVSCESVSPDVCCCRSEDTGRKVTFSTWNRCEIVPWWRLGGSKSCQKSLFKKRYDWITSCRLLHCLVYWHTFSGTNHPFFCQFMFFCLLARFLNNHGELVRWAI